MSDAPRRNFEQSPHSQSQQFRDGKFANSKPRPKTSSSNILRLLWNFYFAKPKDAVPSVPIPVKPVSRKQLEQAPDHSLFRLGHSTILMKINGLFWLTDPVFSERASPFSFMGPKRFHATPIAIEDLPPLAGVILSHNHYDHLDYSAIKALAAKTAVFLTPLGVGDTLMRWGIAANKIQQLDWWQSTEVEGLNFHATPAQHFSGRSLRDGNQTLWCSWVMQSNDLKIFFSGDSGYFDGFKEIGERHGPFDLTLMETGAYNRQWAYVHMLPEETMQAHLDLQGKWLLPIHNGTFDLAMHCWYEPFERIERLAHQFNIPLTTPQFGELLAMREPHTGKRWWKDALNQSSDSNIEQEWVAE